MTEFDSKEGVKAIMYLQNLVDIPETRAQATAGWNGMADWEKESTLDTYRMLSRNKGEKDD